MSTAISGTPTSRLREDNEHLLRENNALKADIAYWKSRHRDSVAREEALQKALEDRDGRIKYLNGQLYGRKRERSAKGAEPGERGEVSENRTRGQQPGMPIPARRDHSHLRVEEEVYDLSDSERFCPSCGLPLVEMPDSEDSTLIETLEVRGYQRKIRRKKYKRGCRCPGTKGITTASGPAKLIPHSRYGASVWIHIIIRKYRLQIPVERILKNLALHGLSIPKGSVGDGLKRLAPLFEPVYEALGERSRQSSWWQADETRWNVFETTKTKSTFNWYLWVFASIESVVYVMDPTRATDVIESHLGLLVEGILLVDRYSAYKAYAKRNDGIILAFCWSHARRDFRDAGVKHESISGWADVWVERIGGLFRHNELRLQYPEGSPQFKRADRQLRETAAEMRDVLDSERRKRKLHHAQRSVLASLADHWEGLTVFLDSPQIPMDNNGSERILRTPVVGRKNYYGSVTHWSARFTAMMFSIFETLALWQINELEWLSDYLRACALSGGRAPEDIAGHLPWNIREERERTWKYSGRIFSESELQTIRSIIEEDTTGMRTVIARTACEQLGWYRDDGELKSASMAKVLTAMEADGLIELPPSRTITTRVQAKPIEHTARTDAGDPVTAGAGELARDLHVEIAESDEQKSLWNEYIDRYHYLGYTPMAGAQLKYLVYSGDRLLALLGFGASAWKIAPREWYIGWSTEKREENLKLVVNNARFLILPWVTSQNLASMILSRVTARLSEDWMQRYRYKPVLLETFVEKKRFTGASYRAANWKHVGATKGRGKMDRFKESTLPVKDIYLYPLHEEFKRLLC
jgi:transposase